MTFGTSLLLGVVFAEALALGVQALELRRLRRLLAERSSRLRTALQDLAHAKNVALFKESSLADLEGILVDAGVLRPGGLLDRSRR